MGLTIVLGAIFITPLASLAVPDELPLPELTVVAYSTPTNTPPPTEVSVENAEDTVSQLGPGPGEPGSDFLLGQLVEVFGTEGEGLRLRVSPSLKGDIILLGLDSEVFEIRDGPVSEDGYIWWQLSNPYDLGQTGWAVSTFLRSIDGG